MPMSRMKTSPALKESPFIGTSIAVTVLRLPLTCSRRARYFSGSTWRKPESTPPDMILMPLGKRALNSSDSWPCTSRYCTGRSSSSVSSSTVLYAAVPASSCVVCEPSQKCTLYRILFSCLYVCSTMYESPEKNEPYSSFGQLFTLNFSMRQICSPTSLPAFCHAGSVSAYSLFPIVQITKINEKIFFFVKKKSKKKNKKQKKKQKKKKNKKQNKKKVENQKQENTETNQKQVNFLTAAFFTSRSRSEPRLAMFAIDCC